MRYDVLKQTHPEYDAELWHRIELLAEAGYRLKRHAKKFIRQEPREKLKSYEYRLSYVAPMAYFGMLLEYLVGALFENGLSVAQAADADDAKTPGESGDQKYWADFSKNADRTGESFQTLMSKAIRCALVKRRAWIQCDFPPALPAENRAEEEALGVGRGYAFHVEPERVLDWSEDSEGNLRFVVLRDVVIERRSPAESRSTRNIRFTVWELDEGGFAKWTRYETGPIALDKEPKDSDELPVTSEGRTSFQRIPLVKLELPFGMWMGNKVGPLAEEHYNRRADLVGAMAPSLREVAYVKRGAEIPGIGFGISQTQTDPNRGGHAIEQAKASEVVKIGADDEIGFAGPSGRAFQLAAGQLEDLKKEIFGVVHAMALAAPDTAAVRAASAQSKREDHRATDIVLSALGGFVRALSVAVYTTISEARRENVVWSPHGLDSFNSGADSEALVEAESVVAIDIPSETFAGEYFTKLAHSLLPSANAATKLAIAEEIRKGVKERKKQADELAKRAHEIPDDEPNSEGSGEGAGSDKKAPPGRRGGALAQPSGAPAKRPGKPAQAAR